MDDESNIKGIITGESYDAVLFDLDGVLTDTARIHAASWKAAFDDFLKRRTSDGDETFSPFDIERDYELYVDGKLRYDGVKSFLESRNIHLPHGTPDSPPGYETICALGNLKQKLVLDTLKREGVDVYEGSIALVRQLREKGILTAVVSASKSCRAVLTATGIEDLFDTRVDGEVAASLNLRGKPAPDTYLKAAELLGVEPERAVVIEDAISGVKAGRDGGFGLVIGVARRRNEEQLKKNGADIVVSDLSELI